MNYNPPEQQSQYTHQGLKFTESRRVYPRTTKVAIEHKNFYSCYEIDNNDLHLEDSCYRRSAIDAITKEAYNE